MLAADQLPKRADSLSSVDSVASNASLSRKPRTTKLRSRSRSAAPDTRRRPSVADDANGSLSDGLFASFSSLNSRSAGHSPLNSPGFDSQPNTQSSSPFLFSTLTQRRPSSAEPPVSQPELQHFRGRHQMPGPSKVSMTQIPHALRAFPFFAFILNQHVPAGSGVKASAQCSPSCYGVNFFRLFERPSNSGRIFRVQTCKPRSTPGFITVRHLIFSVPCFDADLNSIGPCALASVILRPDARGHRSSHASGE